MDFLREILAPEGIFCLVGMRSHGAPRQSFHTSLAELATQAEELIADGMHVYHACSSYQTAEGGRKRENVAHIKSLWLDLDCGDGKPYASQAEAVAALVTFQADIGLPLPLIVNSGNGIHAYWPLTEPLNVEEWQPLADSLKRECVARGLHADAAVTADAARILRLPGSLNQKTDPPRPVYVVQADVTPMSPAKLRMLFGEGLKGLPEKTTLAMSPLAQKLANNKQSRFEKILIRTQMGNGCEQLRYAATHQEDCDYNLWRAALSIAANCVDSEAAIHLISSGHPDYQEDETSRKAQGLVGKPYKCETFESYNPAGCADCPHKGKVGSPISLGNEIREASTDIVEDEEGEGEEENKELIQPFPELPYPYFRGAAGGIYRMASAEDEEDECVIENDLFVIKLYRDVQAGYTVLVRYKLPQEDVEEFPIPFDSINNKEELRKTLSREGALYGAKQVTSIMNYLLFAVRNLQEQQKAEIMRNQFGWADNDSKFIWGEEEISANDIRRSPPSTATKSISKFLVSKGTFSEWARVVSAFDMPGFEPHAFGIFTAFGSPLIKHIGFNGALINLINSHSGTGKSTILKICNSVYGHPERLLAQEADTFAHKMHRLGIMNNLPYTVDEITNMESEKASNLLYGISQGQGANRMQAQINAERQNDTTWSLIGLASSNSSLAEKLQSLKVFAQGEMMRLLEYNLDRTDNIPKAKASELFENALLQNYGHAGPIYLQHLLQNVGVVKQRLLDTRNRIDKEASLDNRERFWSAVIAANLTGAEIARDLGLIDLNVERVAAWAVGDLVPMLREQSYEADVDFISVVGEFLNKNRGAILVIKGVTDKRMAISEAPIVEPKFQVSARSEPDTKLLYIVSKDLRDYCVQNQIIFKDLIRDLNTKGIFRGAKRKRLTRGTAINSPPVDVHIFDNTEWQATIEELDTDGIELDDV